MGVDHQVSDMGVDHQVSSSSAPATTCIAAGGATTTLADEAMGARRSGNYPLNLWDYEFLQTLDDHCTVAEKDLRLAEKLKEEVRSLITGFMAPLAKLEIIDTVQRLGLKYHFEKEINEALHGVHKDKNNGWWVDHLHATSLRFRLLRQSRIYVDPDVFEKFMDEQSASQFRVQLYEDVKGLLSLYEASFLGWENENIMDECRRFAVTHLHNMEKQISPPCLAKRVKHALDLPLHWRTIRFEARWFIDAYEEEEDMNPMLLKFAKLDYNALQTIHHKEISELSRWWLDTRLNNIKFSRNCLIQVYMYAICKTFEPHFGEVRKMQTQLGAILTIIDDVYDIYGSLDELKLFTDIVQRWDIADIDKLPRNIKMPLLAMFNKANDLGYWSLKNSGFNGVPYVHLLWTKQCESYLKEAKWFNDGYTPTLEEYLNNGMVSAGLFLLLITSFLQTLENPTKEALDWVISVPPLIRSSCILCRLINDLGTSMNEMARGDNPKSIQCYMNETGSSLEVARQHVEDLIQLWWKRMNKCIFDDLFFVEPFFSFAVNGVRASHFLYQYGDGFGNAESWTKEKCMSALIHPIPLDDE